MADLRIQVLTIPPATEGTTVLTLLYRSAAAWTALGLSSGLYYRELTKAHDFAGETQLAVAHTHALALGTLMLLALLSLAAALGITARQFRWAVVTWQIGLGLTFAMMLVKGTLQVIDSSAADSPAFAGIAGLGHITLTVAVVMVFLGVRRALQGHDDQHAPVLLANS